MPFHGMSLNSKEVLYGLIHRYQPIARSDLAEIAGLTRASVSNITKEFLKKHLIEESEKVGEKIGRKKILLKIRGDSFTVIGVDIGRRNVVSGLYNADGKRIKIEKKSSEYVRSLRESLEDAKCLVNKLLKWTSSNGKKVVSIGIGVPGPVDPENGIVYCAPYFQKDETVDIKNEFERLFGIPTFVEKDANAAALGEHWFGIGKNYDSFVYLLVVEGIGAGIVVDGRLYRGAHGLSGKIGKFVFPKLEDDGKISLLEEFGSEISALAIAENKARNMKEGYLSSIIKKRHVNVDELVIAFREGDIVAKEVVDIMIYYIAIAVVNIILFADPKLIVIGGDFVKIGPDFVRCIKGKVKKIMGERPFATIEESPIYELSISLGAAARAISETVHMKLTEN